MPKTAQQACYNLPAGYCPRPQFEHQPGKTLHRPWRKRYARHAPSWLFCRFAPLSRATYLPLLSFRPSSGLLDDYAFC